MPQILLFEPWSICCNNVPSLSFLPILNLAMCRHSNILLGRHRILRPPVARNCFLLSVELKSRFPVKGVRSSASNALLVTGEAEHRQWDGDGNVDSNLACFDILLESSSCASGLREACGSISILIGVDQINRSIEGGYIQTN
jgi:hypothetical protein